MEKIFQKLLEDAAIAFRVDARYAEQILLAANTVYLKRNTWALRHEKKAAMDAVLADVLDLEATG